MNDRYFNIDASYRNGTEAVIRTHVHFLDKKSDIVVKCEVLDQDSSCIVHHFSKHMRETCSGIFEKVLSVSGESRLTANAAVIWLDEAGKVNLYGSGQDLPAYQMENISATVSIIKPRAKNKKEIQVYYNRRGDCDYCFPENGVSNNKLKVLMPFAGTVTIDSEEWNIVEIADGKVPKYPAPKLTMFLKSGGSVNYEREIIPQFKILSRKSISWDFCDDWNCEFDCNKISPNSILDFFGKFYIRLQSAVDPNLYRFEAITATSMPHSADKEEKLITMEPIRILYGCMARDTRILMADGSEKYISEIKLGDMVMTSQGPAAIKDRITGIERMMIRITAANGRSIRLSDCHPVLTRRNYVRAMDICVDDVVVLYEGGEQPLSALYMEEYEDQVYNLVTSKPRAALVGNGFWVGDMDMQNFMLEYERVQKPDLPWMVEAKKAFEKLADSIEASSLDEIRNVFCAAGAYIGNSTADAEILSVDVGRLEKITELLAAR